MFGLWFPHSLIRLPNPVFEYEMRRLRWPREQTDLKRYSIRIVLTVCALFGVWWLSGRSGVYRYSGYDASILLLLGFLSFCMMFVTNFYYVLLTIGTINHEIASSEWEQLRLTALKEERILIAKYAILQIRAWRMMAVDIALRAAAVGVVFAGFVYNMMASPGGTAARYFIRDPTAWPLVAALAVVGVAYILEPLWRMRAMVAIAIAIATRVHSFTYAILATLGVVLLMYLAQLVLVLGCGFVFGRVFFTMTTGILIFYCCGIPMIGVTIFQGFYMFYRSVRNRALEYAFRVGFGSKSIRLHVHESYWN